VRPSHRARRVPIRRLAPVSVLALGLVLTACRQPTPLVTMQSGGAFVTTDAAQYQRDGAIVTTRLTPPVLHAKPGETINIDVPSSVAERGYFLSENNRRITDVIKVRHYRLNVATTEGKAGLVVFQAPTGGSSQASGSWPFTIDVSY
jgi:hypothetical protein